MYKDYYKDKLILDLSPTPRIYPTIDMQANERV